MSQVNGAAAPRSRDRDRRAKIVAAATHLFRERGFHAVGIDEIGNAAGITGPGVYRHFSGKDDLLSSVLDHATDDLWTDLSADDQPSIEALVRSHVAYAVTHADAIELWYQEGRNLSAEARSTQRRLQRRYIERWVDALLERRPELSEDEAGVLARGAIGLIHSSAHSDRAGDPALLTPLLERMAMAALLA
ncbi:MAG: putative TetR family transcriptional regulator match [Acidimicrobiales bacterium]|nr:putative TetR family transcriptional regulator match [Acidimicrobiales bacterium]